MSLAAMSWAFQQYLIPAQKIVLLALADYADEEGLCWPGQETLTAKTSLSVRSIRSHIRALEEAGLLITVERRKEGGARATNAYLLQLGGSNPLPADLAGSAPQPARHAESNRQAVAGIAEPSVEPSDNTPLPPSDEELPFNRAWAAWPRKEGKAAAQRAWAKAARQCFIAAVNGEVADAPVDAANWNQYRLLEDTVSRFGAAYARTTPPKFVPHLATWLNQQRWTDPMPVDATRGAYRAEPPRPQQFVVPPGHRIVRDEAGHITGTEEIR